MFSAVALSRLRCSGLNGPASTYVRSPSRTRSRSILRSGATASSARCHPRSFRATSPAASARRFFRLTYSAGRSNAMSAINLPWMSARQWRPAVSERMRVTGGSGLASCEIAASSSSRDTVRGCTCAARTPRPAVRRLPGPEGPGSFDEPSLRAGPLRDPGARPPRLAQADRHGLLRRADAGPRFRPEPTPLVLTDDRLHLPLHDPIGLGRPGVPPASPARSGHPTSPRTARGCCSAAHSSGRSSRPGRPARHSEPRTPASSARGSSPRPSASRCRSRRAR